MDDLNIKSVGNLTAHISPSSAKHSSLNKSLLFVPFMFFQFMEDDFSLKKKNESIDYFLKRIGKNTRIKNSLIRKYLIFFFLRINSRQATNTCRQTPNTSRQLTNFSPTTDQHIPTGVQHLPTYPQQINIDICQSDKYPTFPRQLTNTTINSFFRVLSTCREIMP